jgi:hypothetical protein
MRANSVSGSKGNKADALNSFRRAISSLMVLMAQQAYRLIVAAATKANVLIELSSTCSTQQRLPCPTIQTQDARRKRK